MGSAELESLPVWRNLIYAGMSGAISTTVSYPLDLVKTKLQDESLSQRNLRRSFMASVDKAVHIARSEGILGLYRGWPPNVLLTIPEKALKLASNDYFRAKLQTPDGEMSVGGEMIAGGLAGGVQVIANNPMELLKIQGATQRDKLATGEIHKLSSYCQLLWRLRYSLYTGAVATLLRDIPFSVAYFPLYYQFRETQSSLISGSLAAVLASVLTNPIDVIKTRVHSQAFTILRCRGYFLNEYLAVKTTAIDVVKQQGISSLWKGTIPRCLTVGLRFAVVMPVHEVLKGVLG